MIIHALPSNKSLINLTGKIFGEWRIISYARRYGGDSEWLSLCSCGKTKMVKGKNLKKGFSKSCGHKKS